METKTYSPGELLYRGNYTLIHRARGSDADDSVLFRVLRERDSKIDQAKLHREREILEILGIDSRIAYAKGGSVDGVVGLASADTGGVPLKSLIAPEGMPLTDVMWIAVEVARRLHDLHDQRIIHKDVNTNNVLVDTAERRAALMSYGIASRLPRETHAVVSPEVLEGLLQYISPEQTGRMNRSIDYRSDFYSFGATLYEMLTGQPPFTSDNPREIVHSHIAREPVPPAEMNPEVPPMMSAIAMKLLAKNAEDRYQSARGLIADLEACASSLTDSSASTTFELGGSDRPDRFQVPQRLYGRERELAELSAAFERITAGRAELLLLAGYPGIGKSVLVHEVDKLMVAKAGFLASGKFEQFRRDVPYFAFSGAFRDLVLQLLTQGAEKTAEWKSRIQEAVGDSGQVIIDIIPEVELVIGPQPAVPKLPPTESEALFTAVFQNFLRVFTRAGQALVIFLDDLQWADQASLNLMKTLLSDTENLSLLFVGAYRDNEVSSAHPLAHCLDDLAQQNAPVREITLAPLSASDVAQLAADTLRSEKEPLQELAEILYDKTGGNPFFLLQFFESLYTDGYLTYDEATRRWSWDRSQIQSMESTENVVDLMVAKMKKLGPETQDALRYAAAIGTVFDLDTLATVTEWSRGEAAQHLWGAVSVGQLIPLVDDSRSTAELAQDRKRSEDVTSFVEDLASSYRFLHDRVQQAAYSLTREEERIPMHFRIGRLMWDDTDPEELEERAFEIIHHMNACTGLLETDEERQRLAELNLLAAKRASQSAAYASALKYVRTAAELTGHLSWEDDYDLLFELTLQRAECEYLVRNFDEATKLFDLLVDKARDVQGRIDIFLRKSVLYRHVAQYENSLRASTGGLELAGIEVPWHDDTDRLNEIITADGGSLRAKLEDYDLDALVDLPEMEDPKSLATMDLLAELSMVAYFFNPALLQLSTLKMVLLSLEKGNARASAPAYATYGSTIASGMDLFEEGYKFCKLGLSLSRKLGDAIAESQVSFWFGATVYHWREPVEEGIDLLKSGAEQGLRVGSPIWAGYCAIFIPVHTRFRGTSLAEYIEAHDRYLDVQTENQSLYATIAYRKAVMCLMGELPGRTVLDGGEHLDGSDFVEERYFKEMVEELGLTLSEAHYYNIKQILTYIFREFDEAQSIWKRSTAKGKLSDRLFGQLVNVEWLFYRCLVLASVHDDVDEETAADYRAEIDEHYARLVVWAENAPSNFEAMRMLVAAERARLAEDWAETWAMYDNAIEAAHARGFVNIEALAAERTARYYLSKGRERVAQPYLQLARERFRQWGAEAKAQELETEFKSQLAAAATEGSALRASSLDVGTVTEAYTTLSREIMLDALIERMLQLVIENAGARSGVLLLEQDGALVVTARSIEDGAVETLGAIPQSDFEDLPHGIINYVVQTGQPVVIDEAREDHLFATDPYVLAKEPRSILCLPVELQGKINAVLYLENDLSTAAFTERRVELLKILLAQAAISLENARLYANLEGMVAERTRELEKAVQELEARHKQLQQAQSQLVQSEKMASLGQLVAGIAHEINNPVNFISSGIPSLRRDIATIGEAIPETERSPRVVKVRSRIDKLISAIDDGASRTATIVRDLKSFSRLDEAELKKADLHEALDATLTLLQSQIRDRVDVVKNYGDLPPVDCYISQVNQVFMNLLSNACQAIEGPGTIVLETSRVGDDRVSVSIRDSGRGIPENVRSKIFDPFFTTKDVGEGTGLGLSISQGIIDKHGGTITVDSGPERGTTFVITLPVTPNVVDPV